MRIPRIPNPIVPATPVPSLPPQDIEAVLSRTTALTSQPWQIPESLFFQRDTITVARHLLGCLLLHVTSPPGAGEIAFSGGKIVETEAYLGERDPASHATRARGRASRLFFSPSGLAYVYFIYGAHHCFNVIAHPEGEAGAVLVRALEPLFGIESMAARRAVSPTRLALLCSGPGKLCQALGISRGHNGYDTRSSPLVILTTTGQAAESIHIGPRIGITKAVDWPLRFWLDGSPWISKGRFAG